MMMSLQKGERQKPIKKAMLEEWSNIDNIPSRIRNKKELQPEQETY